MLDGAERRHADAVRSRRAAARHPRVPCRSARRCRRPTWLLIAASSWAMALVSIVAVWFLRRPRVDGKRWAPLRSRHGRQRRVRKEPQLAIVYRSQIPASAISTSTILPNSSSVFRHCEAKCAVIAAHERSSRQKWERGFPRSETKNGRPQRPHDLRQGRRGEELHGGGAPPRHARLHRQPARGRPRGGVRHAPARALDPQPSA